jgi:hypothetical protein
MAAISHACLHASPVDLLFVGAEGHVLGKASIEECTASAAHIRYSVTVPAH